MSEAPASRAPDAAFREREFPFTPRDFRRISTMLYEDAGIVLGDTKAPLVYARLVKRLRALGVESFRRYCELVASDSGSGERRRMTAALTTNVTRFLREPHHFEHLRQVVLPPLVETVRAGAPLRIWSAGCSSGEEPYSIALSVLTVLPDAPALDVRILATDISPDVLQQGADGLYPEAALAPVARTVRLEHFVPEEGERGARMWRVGEQLRSLVTFRALNLRDDWPMRQRYHAIFCRNVVIYFDPATRTSIWRRMAPLLAPDGRLYVGHSERVAPEDAPLHFERLTTYRRVGDG